MKKERFSCSDLQQKQKILEDESQRLQDAILSLDEERIADVRKNIIDFLSQSHFLKEVLQLAGSIRV